MSLQPTTQLTLDFTPGMTERFTGLLDCIRQGAYGSCSGCDTLQRIHEYSDEPPTESQVEQYMMLALHILQGLKRMGDDNQTGPFG